MHKFSEKMLDVFLKMADVQDNRFSLSNLTRL